MSRVHALVDILLALLLTVLGGLAVGLLLKPLLELPLLVVLALQGVFILIGLQLLLRWRGQRWRDLGLPAPAWRDVGRALQALLLVFATNIALTGLTYLLAPELLAQHQEQLVRVAGMLTHQAPLLAVAVVVLFIGLYEELLARGFLLRRSRTLLGGIWGPVLLSSLLFGLGHSYQGWTGVVQTAVIGVVLARLTLRWGTLWPAILAHAALNMLSLTLLPNTLL
jgi:uncharacterized protein